jgi:hypothetical protein
MVTLTSVVLICHIVAGNPNQTVPPFLAVDGQIIGKYVNRRWHNVSSTFGLGTGHLRLRKVGIGTVGSYCDVDGIELGGASEEGLAYLKRATQYQDVLVFGLEPLIPRPVKKADKSSCLPWLRAYLKTKGIRNAKPIITNAVSVDLDGDGKNEVLVEAMSRNGLASVETIEKRDDYSCVLIKISNKTIPLHFNKGSDHLSRIRALSDIDGNGRFEIIAEQDYYEGGSAMIYTYSNGKLTLVASNGDGT